MTPLESAGLSIETDWLYKMYNRNFLLNDGRPGGLIVVKGIMSEDDKSELRARYRGNINTVGRIGVIASEEGADFVDTAIHPRDAAYIEGKKITEEEIEIAFGVPRSVLGNASGRTFDNSEMERLIFWMETMASHLQLIERPLDVLDSDPQAMASFDISGVDVIQRAEIKRLDFLVKEVLQGLRTANEYRPEAKLPQLAQGGDEVYILNTYMPIGGTKKTAVGDAQAVMAAGRPPPAGSNGPGTEGRPQDKPTNQDGEDPEPSRKPGERKPRTVAASANGHGELGPYPAEQIVRLVVETAAQAGTTPKTVKVGPWRVPADDLAAIKEKALDDQERWTLIFEGAFKRLQERQQRVLREKVTSTKMSNWMAKRATWKGAPVIENLFDQEAWDTQLRDDFEPLIAGVLQEFANEVCSTAKIADIDLGSPEAMAIKQYAIDRLLIVNASVKRDLEESLWTGVKAEEPKDRLATRVDSVLARAVLPVSEARSVALAGQWLAAEKWATGSKDSVEKVWLGLEQSVQSDRLPSLDTFEGCFDLDPDLKVIIMVGKTTEPVMA